MSSLGAVIVIFASLADKSFVSIGYVLVLAAGLFLMLCMLLAGLSWQKDRDEEKDNEKLKTLLGSLAKLISTVGPRDNAVKRFVQEHKDVKEFPTLAATLILVAESMNEKG
jgi:hypothetical protein